MSDNNSTSSGVGFTGLLLIAFIVLKLCGVIDWSWWWVLSPFWIPCSIVLIALGVLWALRLFNRAKYRKNMFNKLPEPKSKWQKRMEEMHKKQKTESN